MKEPHTSVKAMFLIIPDVTDNTENQGPLGARGQCSMVHTAPGRSTECRAVGVFLSFRLQGLCDSHRAGSLSVFSWERAVESPVAGGKWQE